MKIRLKVDELNNDNVKDIASLIFEESDQSFEIQPGCCLKCGSAYPLKSLHVKADEAETSMESLQLAVLSNKVDGGCLSDALRHFEVLNTILHPYNKILAQAHDILAEAFCSDGQPQRALDHCLASIEILKKIYGHGHIALGNELLKLSSLQLALADASVAETANQMDTIFSKYYGQHAQEMFPLLKYLKAEVHNLSKF